MSNNLSKTAVLKKKTELQTKATAKDFTNKFWGRKCA